MRKLKKYVHCIVACCTNINASQVLQNYKFSTNKNEYLLKEFIYLRIKCTITFYYRTSPSVVNGIIMLFKKFNLTCFMTILINEMYSLAIVKSLDTK